MNRKLKILVMDNIRELGEKVNNELKKINKCDQDYLLSFKTDRFSNGEGKAKILESVSGSDLYILSDIGNYGISYLLHGREHFMSPDEHFEDIKRVIAAISGHSSKINFVPPS